VVAERIHLRAVEALPPGHPETVGRKLDVHAHAPEILAHRGDTVGFLQPQLGGVANDQAFFTHRSQHRQDGNLVDQRSREGLFDGSAAH